MSYYECIGHSQAELDAKYTEGYNAGSSSYEGYYYAWGRSAMSSMNASEIFSKSGSLSHIGVSTSTGSVTFTAKTNGYYTYRYNSGMASGAAGTWSTVRNHAYLSAGQTIGSASNSAAALVPCFVEYFDS